MKLIEVLERAKKQRWAIGQFNFSTLEQLRAIVEASQRLSWPVVVGISQGGVDYLGLDMALAMVRTLEKRLGTRPFLHFDHARDWSLIKKAIDIGYDSVHFDGSHLPFSKNLKLTKKIVQYAHNRGVLVEAEINPVLGKSTFLPQKKIRIKKEQLTDPRQASEFIKETNIDSLAVLIGNVHGVCEGGPNLDFGRLKSIRKEVKTFLVLHGGSGIKTNNLKRAVKMGIQKVNINTELRIVWRKELERSLKRSKSIKPYVIFPSVIKPMERLVEKYIKTLKVK
jgi:fructose-bisphosphate aldolase class II